MHNTAGPTANNRFRHRQENAVCTVLYKRLRFANVRVIDSASTALVVLVLDKCAVAWLRNYLATMCKKGCVGQSGHFYMSLRLSQRYHGILPILFISSTHQCHENSTRVFLVMWKFGPLG